MAALTTQRISITGLVATYTSAGGSGDTIEAAANVFLHVKNGSGASINVTVAVPGTEYGVNRADAVIAVAAGAETFIEIPRELADSSDHRVHVTYSASSSVTVAALGL